MKAKRYEVEFEKGEHSPHSLFGISLTKKPAIKRGFHFYSEDTHTEVYSDAEQGVIVGPIMVPDMPIRREGNEEYVFTKEGISNAMYSMSTGGDFNRFTIEHNQETYDVKITEFWQKEGEADKSSNYGYSDLPVGTAFIKAQVEDEGLKQLIRDGELSGFSVEMTHGLKPINYSQTSDTQMAGLTPEQLEEIKSRVAEQMKAEAEAKAQAEAEALETARKEAEESARKEAEQEARIEAIVQERLAKASEAAAAEVAAASATEGSEVEGEVEGEGDGLTDEEREAARILSEQGGEEEGEGEGEKDEDPRKTVVPKIGTDAYDEYVRKMTNGYRHPKAPDNPSK